MAFVHLHVHSEYSLLDGTCSIEPMLEKVKSMGQTAVAITDHGVMYGVLQFYKSAKAKGIKPIIGCEVYVAPRSRYDKINGIDNERYHLTLLCKNNRGYQNLIKLVSEGWINGFYGKPRVDREILEKYSEGIIALSGCLSGEISKFLLKGDFDSAKAVATWYQNVFGKENYYLEIQNHNLAEQVRIFEDFLRLSKECDIPLVATNDAHYIDKNDDIVQKVLICIQTNHNLGESTGIDFETDEFYLKSEEEMLEAFSFYPQAVDNSAKIAEMCNVEFEFGKTQLPYFKVPDEWDHVDWFNKLCWDGLKLKYGESPPQECVDRMEYELNVINSMGYTDYYLIVYDFINYAKSKGIPVGPGRGSGAASICAYALGITGIDPIKHNLLFERFLNPERVSMPDFDVDFCYERRQEVIDYVINKYGDDHVAQIVTFGTFAAKAAIRDVGRVMGLSYSFVDNVAKMVPNGLNITIDDALSTIELKQLYETDKNVKELIDLSKRIEGMPRHSSTHAAGVVITEKPVWDYVPLAKNDDCVVTQFDMKGLESLGLLKMDFLGLRNLTVIDSAVKMIKEINPTFDINEIDLQDKETFELFCNAQTQGVFQFESAGMRRVLMQLQPSDIEDIIAVISLYRPGPMDSIPEYIRNKNNPGLITYDDPKLEKILKVTHGCIVYQEQVMQICREVAGYSYGRADIVRRAMSKKQQNVMLDERKNFLYGLVDENGETICEGAVNRGVDEKVANKIFDKMVSFASYAFNKAHAAAYAYVAYQTAYLKCHYPAQFLASYMTAFSERTDKVEEAINECSRLSITVMPPHINNSTADFEVLDNKIYFSLSAIKNIGSGLINTLVKEREFNGNFIDIIDFCNRMYGKDFNRRALESLIKCGALDGLGYNRRTMFQSIELILSDIENKKKKDIEGQIGFEDFFSDEDTPLNNSYELEIYKEFSIDEMLRQEKELSGVYLSGHPMKKYSNYYKPLKCDLILDILEDNIKYKDACKVKCLVMFSSVTKKLTKNNNTMANVIIEDTSASIQALIFPKYFEKYYSQIYDGAICIVHGTKSINDDSSANILVDVIEQVPKDLQLVENSAETEKKEYTKLFIRFDSINSPQVKICDNLISIFEGNVKVYYYFKSTQEYKFFCSCDANSALIDELINLLGKENVVLKK